MAKKGFIKTITLILVSALFFVFGSIYTANAASSKTPGAVTKLTAKQSKTQVTLKYKKASKAKRYAIYRSSKKSSGYKKIGTTKKLKYTDKSAVSTKTYYYKVRAYTKSGKKTKYGKYSNIKKITIAFPNVKKVLYENVSNLNNSKVTDSNLSKREDWVDSSKKIDRDIQNKASSGSYSFARPYIKVNPYRYAPLTAVVAFKTDKAYSVEYTVKGDTEICNVSGNTDAATVHAVPIIGLYANRTNNVTIKLLDNGTVVSEQTLKIKTGNIPSGVSNQVTVVKHSAKSVFGLTLVTGQDCRYPFAYDENGKIRWVITRKGESNSLFPLSGGKFLFQAGFALAPSHAKPHATILYEMDYLGRTYSQFYIAQGVHHDVTEKVPGGNLMLISNSNDGYVEDVVMEIDRNTGAVVKQLNVQKVLGNTYRNKTDWAHLNTISYDPESDTVLLSPRNTHSAIKVKWSTQKLVWIMSNPEMWKNTSLASKVLKPKGKIQWHYQQHAVYELKEDIDNNKNTKHYIMFDNHYHTSRKVAFFDNLPNSYSLIYTVNEKDFTIKQEKVFSGLKSDITSNSILDWENKRMFGMHGHLKKTYNGNHGMIYEYDYNTEKVINQYAIKGKFYRAYKMTFNCDVMESGLQIPLRYVKGMLQSPIRLSYMLKLPSDKLKSKYASLSVFGNVLYVKADGHAVQSVVFIGKKNTYVWDKSKINQTDKKYLKWNYSMPVPLAGLKAGTYEIALRYKGKFYTTKKHIKIN